MTDQQLPRRHSIKNLQEAPPAETPRRGISSRKPKDPDYDGYLSQQEKGEPGSLVYSSDIQWEKERAVSVHASSCVVCGHSNRAGRAYTMAYVLEKSLAGNQETIKHLERSWGLEPGTFFLHSPLSTMMLCPNCYTALTKHIFGLLPRTQIIDVVQDFAKWTVEERKMNPGFQLFGDKPLQYRVVDIDWTGDDPFVVYVRGRNNKVRVKAIYPPFDHPLLSNIELNVNPVYMIWWLGLKLEGIDVRTIKVPESAQEDLFRVQQLFHVREFEGEDPAVAPGSPKSKAEGAKSVTEAAISERETVYSVTSEPDAAPSELEATSSVRRSKRLRSAPSAHNSTDEAPPPPKRSKKGRSAGSAS